MNGSYLKKPGAFLPIAMSAAALAVVLGHIAFFGVAREAGEGPAAHIWQLLMAGQLPIILFHAVRWLPRNLRPALQVLAMQIVAAVAALIPVRLLGL